MSCFDCMATDHTYLCIEVFYTHERFVGSVCMYTLFTLGF